MALFCVFTWRHFKPMVFHKLLVSEELSFSKERFNRVWNQTCRQLLKIELHFILFLLILLRSCFLFCFYKLQLLVLIKFLICFFAPFCRAYLKLLFLNVIIVFNCYFLCLKEAGEYFYSTDRHLPETIFNRFNQRSVAYSNYLLVECQIDTTYRKDAIICFSYKHRY